MLRILSYIIFPFVTVYLFSCDQNRFVFERLGLADSLVVAVDSEPQDGFDPLLGWGRYGYPYFHSTLLKRDRGLHIIADLAEIAQLSQDKLVWKIRIRPDAVFSDGVALTAQDVAFTYQQAAQQAGKIDLSVVESVVVKNRTQLEIRLKRPQITFVNQLVSLGIVPRHAYGPDYGRTPIGSGPYRLVRWDEGRQMIMETNPYYYGSKPLIHQVVFLYLQEESAVAAARAGKVHVAKIPQALTNISIEGMRLVAVQSVDNRGISFPMLPDTGQKDSTGRRIGNNVTSDIAIRKAINLALDRVALVQGVLEGHGRPAFGPVSGLPWEQTETRLKDTDPLAARSILTRAGWNDTDDDGIVEKDRVEARFTLLYPCDDMVRQSLSLAVSDRLKKIGVSVEVMGKSWEEIYRLMHTHAVMFGFGSLDQTEMHNLFHSNNGGMLAHNAGLYRNPQVDLYLEQAMQAKNESEAIKFWKLAQWDGKTGFSALGDAPWAWLVNVDHTYYVSNKIDFKSLFIEQHGSGITANIADWSWKEIP